MYTTITVNGPDGSLFLSHLGASGRGLPTILACLARDAITSLEVETELAEEVGVFIDKILTAGTLPGTGSCGAGPGWSRPEPPLLFSPHVGDEVAIVRDVLVELQTTKRSPRVWRCVARGTRGRVVARQHDGGRVVLLDGRNARAIASVRDRSMTDLRFWRWPSAPGAAHVSRALDVSRLGDRFAEPDD